MKIQELFDRGAADYDLHRRKVIPCFDDFYNTLVRQVPFKRDESFSVLDLGAGTGLVTALILEFFPNARAALVDLSEKMLLKAQERFAGDDRIIGCFTMDYSADLPAGCWDLAVSAMSIHHLSDPEKKALFDLIHSRLNPSGAFIHADLIKGKTDKIDSAFIDTWKTHIKGCGFSSDALEQLWERMAQDRPAKLSDQLAWMNQAGFEGVDLFFEYNNFAVYGGAKTPAA